MSECQKGGIEQGERDTHTAANTRFAKKTIKARRSKNRSLGVESSSKNHGVDVNFSCLSFFFLATISVSLLMAVWLTRGVVEATSSPSSKSSLASKSESCEAHRKT